MRQTLQLAVLALTLAVGCSPPASGTDVGTDTGTDSGSMADAARDVAASATIIDQEAWQPVDAADDPFDDRPETFDCEPGIGWGNEELEMSTTVEVATGSCDYLGITQPLLGDVAAGETLLVHLVHFELVGGTEAHAAIAIDGEMVWETRIPIPQENFGVIEEEFEVPAGASAGAPIVFHLHNHGQNTYNLIDIRRLE